MKRSTKFCRCIKTVRKRVGEKGAIGICVHSILQRKGRTLKKFSCGKKPRLVTQKLKKKGGSQTTWESVELFLNENPEDTSVESLRKKLDIVKGNIKSLEIPTGTDESRWMRIIISLFRHQNGQTGRSIYFQPGLMDLVIETLQEMAKRVPTKVRYRMAFEDLLDRFSRSVNPEENQVASALLPYLRQRGGSEGSSWETIREISEDVSQGNTQQLDSLKSLIEKVDLPANSADNVRWLQTFGALKNAAVSRGGDTLLTLLGKVVSKHPGDSYMIQYIPLAIESLQRGNQPELLAVANAIKNAAGASTRVSTGRVQAA